MENHPIQFRRWLWRSLLCGASSFVYGALVTESRWLHLAVMLVGIVTLAACFALVDSRRLLVRARSASPLWVKAQAIGIRLRCYYAVLSVLSAGGFYVVATTSGVDEKLPFAIQLVVRLVVLVDMAIGRGAMTILGFRENGGILHRAPSHPVGDAVGTIGPMQELFQTYLTTLLTGLMHGVILAALCLLIYAAMCVFGKKTVLDSGK